MPAPFAGAAATDATAVPWYSSRPKVDWSFWKVVLGRAANSGWVGSVPLSMIVTGTPGPGAVSPATPMWASHHSCPWRGSSRTRAEAVAAVAADTSASAKTRRSRRPKGHGRVAGDGTGLRRARLESRRPRGDDPGRPGRAPRGTRRPRRRRLLARRDRARRGGRPAPLPERGRRPGHEPRPRGSPRPPPGPRTAVRPGPGGRPGPGPEDARSRPPALRKRPDSPARARDSAPAPPRAGLRPGSPGRTGPVPRSAWKGRYSDAPRRATLRARMGHLDDLDEYEAELELRLK